MSGAFVILAHSGHGPLHYDLMLEHGGSLATWHLPCLPADLPAGQAAHARKLPDHRTAYLTYEGPVSGGRGHVRRVGDGTYEGLCIGPKRWLVRLAGPTGQDLLELRCEQGDDDWQVRRLIQTPG